MTDKTYPARVRARVRDRNQKLRALGFRDYRHYLSSPQWLAVKARHREAFGEICGLCGTKDDKFSLHHMTYERVGQEQLSDLVLLCVGCHTTVHALEKRGEMGLDFEGLANFKRAAVYAAEQAARRQAAKDCYTQDDWTEEMWVQALDVAMKRVRRLVKELPVDRGNALIADIQEYARSMQRATQEGTDYVPSFDPAESSLDFQQPFPRVLAQIAGCPN